MIKSKRFLITVIILVVYLIGITIFKLDCKDFAIGLTTLLTPYLLGQSLRGSNKNTI